MTVKIENSIFDFHGRFLQTGSRKRWVEAFVDQLHKGIFASNFKLNIQ
jgi:hypothetical protein